MDSGNTFKKIFLISISILALLAGCVNNTGTVKETGNVESYRTVTDMRGVEVRVPENIERVATVSDGLVESVMLHLGVEDRLVGLGSECLPKLWEYEFESVTEGKYTYTGGMNPVNYLRPEIRDLPLFAKSGAGMNYETLAGLAPDVVILRIGCCTIQEGDDERIQKTIETIESLGLPLIVLYGPPYYSEPEVDTLTHEIRIIGELFERKADALELATYLENITVLIRERTAGIPEEDKPDILIFGLSPNARSSGGAGTAHGLNTMESYFIEDMANARNAYGEAGGSFQILSTEKVLSLDPDVIVLCTAWGYHPPSELYEAPYYQSISELAAVKNRRVWALPWTPCNCAKRLEYPIEALMIAKAAYPERFEDIVLSEWVLEFYKRVYNVSDGEAEGVRSAQWLDWAIEEGV